MNALHVLTGYRVAHDGGDLLHRRTHYRQQDAVLRGVDLARLGFGERNLEGTRDHQ
ncbi:hypothetical protein SDC9_171935 [bioreactor metagenome]|uniref:Uncharacterized protein n=1 Tax=bioreactor metagenome TaxID=1076179 RepID=A0A645GEF7_9ZZZZ